MATQAYHKTDAIVAPRTSWVPMLAIGMAQALLVLNVTMLKVAIDGIASSVGASASAVKTAVVVYSLAVAALIMMGAKVDELLGARRVFRLALIAFAGSMALMACSPGPATMIVAQAGAGAASGVLVPALIMLISDNYRGDQQTRALGWLAAVQTMSIVPAILLAGALATWPGWRYAFGVLVLLALGIHKLSERLRPAVSAAQVRIDKTGVVLAVVAVFLIGLGCNNVTAWGPWWARPRAPFSLFDLSPAPFAIVLGALLIKVLIAWSRHVQAVGGTPLVPLSAFGSRQQRSMLLSMFMVGVIGSAITYVIPLYIEIVQGRSTWYTAIALLPFATASFVTAILVGRMRGQARPNRIASLTFLVVASGSLLLGATLHNDWGVGTVVSSMILLGAGEGALATLLFRLLAASSTRATDADVMPLCGTTDYLAAGIGTALASALVIAALASGVQRELIRTPVIPESLKAQVDLENVSFISNDRLRAALSRTSATPAQVDEGVRINTQVRLDALRLCFFVLAGLAMLALWPVRNLPEVARYAPPQPEACS